jgi:hypothetical protein
MLLLTSDWCVYAHPTKLYVTMTAIVWEHVASCRFSCRNAWTCERRRQAMQDSIASSCKMLYGLLTGAVPVSVAS